MYQQSRGCVLKKMPLKGLQSAAFDVVVVVDVTILSPVTTNRIEHKLIMIVVPRDGVAPLPCNKPPRPKSIQSRTHSSS